MDQQLRQARVLVTGATGFTGSVLARQLIQAGASVRAIARASSNRNALADLPIEWFTGDVYDPAAVSAAADGVHYVFHVAASFRNAKVDDAEYARVHVESTKLLAQAAAGNPSFRRFVHVSTMGVHGHIENPPGDENSPYAPGDIYQRTKLEGELWLREFAAAHRLAYAVIRPTAIYGPGDRRLLKVFKMALWPVFPILGHGRCLYHLVHVEDLGRAMMLAAVHPAAAGEVFLAGSEEAIALEEMARIIAEECGRSLNTLRIPAGPFFIAADLCEAVCKPLGIEPPLYRRRVAFYTKDRSFSTAKIRNLLGFKSLYTDEEGLRLTTRWYAENGWINAQCKPEGGRRDRHDEPVDLLKKAS